jgi:hypothetical protein
MQLLTRETNWARCRLKDVEGTIRYLALVYGVRIPEDGQFWLTLSLINVNISRVYTQRKMEIGNQDKKRKKEKRDESTSTK